jgi:hypothetical protein
MEVPRETERSGTGPALRVVGEPADVPVGTQMGLPLRWCFAHDPGEIPADVLAIQPKPVQWLVSHLWIGGRCVTAVARHWRPGDTRKCRLCKECDADHGLSYCQVLVGEFVPVESAALLDVTGTRYYLVNTGLGLGDGHSLEGG